jgi:hypothetical protein
MTNDTKKPDLFSKASGGNKDALNFLCAAYEHFFAIRKFITSGSTDPHEFIGLMAKRIRPLPFAVNTPVNCTFQCCE